MDRPQQGPRGQVTGDLRIGQGRPERGGEVFPQRRRRGVLAGLLQRLPDEGVNEPPPRLGQFTDLRAVERSRGGAQLIAELDELAGHPRVGADQLIDHPGGPGGLARAICLAAGRSPAARAWAARALRRPVNPSRVRAVQLGGGLIHEIGTAHPVIVPRARTPHHYRRDPPRAVRSAPVDGAGKEYLRRG